MPIFSFKGSGCCCCCCWCNAKYWCKWQHISMKHQFFSLFFKWKMKKNCQLHFDISLQLSRRNKLVLVLVLFSSFLSASFFLLSFERNGRASDWVGSLWKWTILMESASKTKHGNRERDWWKVTKKNKLKCFKKHTEGEEWWTESKWRRAGGEERRTKCKERRTEGKRKWAEGKKRLTKRKEQRTERNKRRADGK